MKKLIIAAIVNTYLIILAGSIVRTTGSGMGCPDWPKCFGQLVPPTNASQLPTNYKDIYIAKRIQKNEKLAKYLSAAGFNDLAYLIVNDPTIKTETDFNATKAWIEYVNRLLGVVLGPLLLALLWVSYKRKCEFKGIFSWALAVFLITLFQGWLGSIVVSTNLLPGTITVHMLLAFVILAILIRMLHMVSPIVINAHEKLKYFSLVTLSLSLLQVYFGTEVRKEVDVISYQNDYDFRNLWISQLDWKFYMHRSFSLFVLVINGFLLWKLKPISEPLSKWILGIIGVEILSGITLTYFDFPAAMQPVHIVLASILFGVQFLLWLRLRRESD